MTGRWWIWEVMKDLIGFHWTLFTLFTHTFILQFAVFWYEASSLVQTKKLYFFPLLLSTTTLTAAPRGNRSGIIMGIQFGFVNVDRALLHPDTRVRWKWSSAFRRSVASLSSKLLSSASADRRASHSSLKGLFFFCPFPVRGEVHGALSLAQPFGSLSGSGLKNQQPIFLARCTWVHVTPEARVKLCKHT